MDCISVFDMLKIGVGPSSSHTLGPWRAAQAFLVELQEMNKLTQVQKIIINLYGSLSLTGKGHATDFAVLLGLTGADPEYIPVEDIQATIQTIKTTHQLYLNQEKNIPFDFDKDIIFNREFLDFHPNGMMFTAYFSEKEKYDSTFFSIGGGFINKGDGDSTTDVICAYPYQFNTSEELLRHCDSSGLSISELMRENERTQRTDQEIDAELMRVWSTMLECMYIGCHTEGVLPGGLNVRRRAYDLYQKLKAAIPYQTHNEWIYSIRKTKIAFREIFKWVSCYALAVNEVNASLGRVVTAPTNGSAGVIPAVLMYYLTIDNHKAGEKEIKQFLMVAGVIGSIFKKGATISAAMGGCQAEIGVSSAMAAGALCELLGGTPEQVTIAAEIAMEHHLGLTCDPIAGLVQVPCIERNAMGAIKAINAAELALETNPKEVKVTLDDVVKTMWETAKDMNNKYKETSEGGLAVAVNIADC